MCAGWYFGVHVQEQLPAGASDAERVEFVMADLKAGLEGMARALFGDVEMRWVDAYFPFTDPSAELEIFFGVSAVVVMYLFITPSCSSTSVDFVVQSVCAIQSSAVMCSASGSSAQLL